jgi:RNA-directed DNA polymerase
VSALVASPTRGVGSFDAVRALQHALYRAAKADPGRRFHALYDKVHRRDVMWRAWGQVRRNNGAAGIDHTTLADVEEYGVARLLGELEAELKAGAYRPLPAGGTRLAGAFCRRCSPTAGSPTSTFASICRRSADGPLR